MANVTLTAALRSNLLNLQGTAKLLSQTQLRLSSGKKVNGALDNPTSYFAAASLNNRADDLSNLLDGMGQATQVLQAADQGIKSLTSLVQQAQSIEQQANNELSSSGAARSGDISAASVASLTAGGMFAIGDKFSLTGSNTPAVTFTIAANETLAQLASAINGTAGFSAQVVAGSSTAAAGSQRLEIRATSGQTLLFTDVVAGTTAKIQANNAGAGGVIGARLDTGAAIGQGAGNTIASVANAPDQISLENQYNAIRTQIDSLITDAGYQGTNLLNGDTLKTQFNEKNTSTQSVTGVTFNSAGLTIAAANFSSSANITSAAGDITNALTKLRTQAQSFGNNLVVIQTRQDFTQTLINTLKSGADLLTLADKNEEGANLLSLQTAQQLGIQALSLASQANQSVLRLFG
jgi:flagellin